MANRWNVQRLQPLELEPVHMSLQIDTRAFYTGYVAGLTDTQECPRFDVHGSPSEQGIIEIVRNLCEMSEEHELTETTLLHDCGLIAGWLLRRTRT